MMNYRLVFAKLTWFLFLESYSKYSNMEFRNFLMGQLPSYMVPAYFVELVKIPLNQSGKVDEKALPLPNITRASKSAKKVANQQIESGQNGSRKLDNKQFDNQQTENSNPEHHNIENNNIENNPNEFESGLLEIWSKLLKQQNISIDDNFFDIGGHSLLLAEMQAQITKLFGVRIPMVKFFDFTKIRSLALFLASLKDIKTEKIPAAVQEKITTPSQNSQKIAVVGMAVRLPGADSPSEYWNNLAEGVESIKSFSKQQIEKFLKRKIDENLIPAYGMVKGTDLFDAGFFGYSPKEASIIDPQQRLFLECCWEALESAGQDPDRFKGAIGTYAGQGHSQYSELLRQHPDLLNNITEWQLRLATGSDFIASRVAYKLGLSGPAINIQTACSTSLVAICQAVQGLLAGDCDMALAGGASVNYIPRFGQYEVGGILSQDGHCRPFDSEAGGTVASDGVAVVLLKRYEDAIRDGNTIHSVIIGHALNNDASNKMGFAAPSAEGQAKVISKALASAGLEPKDISYIEAHGTATSLGDPIEASGLVQAFGESDQATCFIGSAKSNIGHTDVASGAAGFIKTTLALQAKIIPKSLHFDRLNPEIDFAKSPFRVCKQLQPWTLPAAQMGAVNRRAGVSSFGIGGTNAHVILEESPVREQINTSRKHHIIPISAQTQSQIQVQMVNLRNRLLTSANNITLGDIAVTLQLGRREMLVREHIVAADLNELLLKLKGSIDRSQVQLANDKKDFVLLFPGQGGQYVGMGRDLYAEGGIFRETCDACFSQFYQLGIDIKAIFISEEEAKESHAAAESLLQDMTYAQAAIFTIELALAHLILSLVKKKPQALAAHSLGMYAAACISGIFSLPDACKAVAERAKLFNKAPRGAMLAINSPLSNFEDLLDSKFSISAINSSSQIVISGLVDDITAMTEKLDCRNLNYRRLHISAAAHSHLMDSQVRVFEEFLKTLKLNKPHLPLISDLTGTWLTAEQACSPSYWASHLNSTVVFHKVLKTLKSIRNAVFIENGPGRSLITLFKNFWHSDDIITTVSLPHALDNATSAQLTFYSCIGALWQNGIPIEWSEFNKTPQGYRVSLPTYPFQYKKFQIGNFDLSDLTEVASVQRAIKVAGEPQILRIESDRANVNDKEADKDKDGAGDSTGEQNNILNFIIAEFANGLGLPHMEAEANFFEYGGDSLTAIQILKKLRTKYAIEIPIKSIFKNPTPTQMAQFIITTRKSVG